MGLALKRAGGGWHLHRRVTTALIALVIVFIADVDAYVTILMGLAGMIVIGTIEHFLYEGGSPAIEDERMFDISG